MSPAGPGQGRPTAEGLFAIGLESHLEKGTLLIRFTPALRIGTRDLRPMKPPTGRTAWILGGNRQPAPVVIRSLQPLIQLSPA